MDVYDYLVIGAGPAGLQMGYYFAKTGKNYLIVEKSAEVGNTFRVYPRHRQLISINKPNTGFDSQEINYRWDWNSLLNDSVFFPKYSQAYYPPADSLCDYLSEFAQMHELSIRFNTDITCIRKNNGEFEVEAAQGNLLRAKKLIIATGFNDEKMLDFPGCEHVVPYSQFEIDPEVYKNKRVLILGKGNSAFETADSMMEHAVSIHLCSPTPVRLAWESHYVGNVRAVNNDFLDTYQLKSQNVVLDAEIESIQKQGNKYRVDIRYTHAKDEKRTIYYDKVLGAVGFRFNNSMFDASCKPEMCAMKKFPALNNDWSSRNVSGMYFAGVLMHSLDFRKTMSGFIHGFRYNVQALAKILDENYHGNALSPQPLDQESPKLAAFVADRMTNSSSMFLQPGFLGDIYLEGERGDLSVLPDLPLNYFHTRQSKRNDKRRYFTVSLEYGDWSKVSTPFAIDRDPDPAKAHLVEYIHPIIREYKNNELVSEFHLPEDLENVYDQQHFIDTLTTFFESKLEQSM